MKKLLLILLITMSQNAFIKAQVVLPSASFPVAGDVFNLISADTIAVIAGPGGAELTWDFSTVTNTGQTETDSFKTVAETPFGAYYPTAAMSLHAISPDIDEYVYYDNTGTTIENMGNATPAIFPDTPTIIHYTPSLVEYQFPFVYGNEFQDSTYYSYPESGYLHHGSVNVKATGDAYGELTTPLGTYPDVERIVFVRVEIDTLDTDHFPTVHTKRVTSTNWYSSAHFYPLFSITEIYLTSSGSPSHYIKSVDYSTGGPISSSAGISEKSPDSFLLSEIYPNPARDEANFKYHSETTQKMQISIHDLLGKLVFSTTKMMEKGDGAFHIDTHTISNGIYTYSIQTKNNQINGKLIIRN